MRKFILALLIAALLFSQLSIGRSSNSGGTVSASNGEGFQSFYYNPHSFSSFGSWKITGDILMGRVTASDVTEADPSNGVPAIAEARIVEAGQYRLWVRDRDYAINQPGTRTFHVAVDGVMNPERFGDHGQEGFRWSDAGIYLLEEGIHQLELHDTSGFYARTEGLFLTNDLSLVPPEDKEALLEIAKPIDPFESLPAPTFPAWAKEEAMPAKSASIENDTTKLVFYQGEGEYGELVQNEIYIKDEGSWKLVKGKQEELGFLMMAALATEWNGMAGYVAQVRQSILLNDAVRSKWTTNFFETGIPVWFIPSDFQKLDSHTIELSFPNIEADLKVTFQLDQLTDDPKVTLDAQFVNDGVYSFLLYSGDSVAYEEFDTVTAPLVYVKKAVPAGATILPESHLFTPMATLNFKGEHSRIAGKEFTSGIAIDPASVPLVSVLPETSHFGLVLRDQLGEVRPQFIAPMLGTAHSVFEAGDRYQISYRILNRAQSWYDTFKDVTQALYGFKDIRTNYFHSLNEAIYNATDLMMDDDYGGWDPVNMAHYNMEEKEMTTMANMMSAVQRYLLTENEELLDTRAVPTLATLLSRQTVHFKATTSTGGARYTNELPVKIGGPIKNYTASVYGGLYEMTQGRMPFLMDTAINFAKETGDLAGVSDQAALYKYTENEAYLAKVRELADQYLTSHPNTGPRREIPFVSSFELVDYTLMVATFIAAYEATGDQKYLDAAEENAHLLATGVVTVGYHDNYAVADYVIDPVATAARTLFVDAEGHPFWWHGSQQWRLGNIDGEIKKPQESGPPLLAETVPGWLVSRAGLATEHPNASPENGTVIYMNTWAGMMVKLSEYTGDPYFETMARNAIIGRFGNYAGYYQDRPIVHQMRADYPYTGPDYTMMYWHHIPVFISMLEDFLINSVWSKSERHISFPSITQSGYAYFVSNQYGQAPGKFYDENDMWLWLDRAIIELDSVEINYIAARKNGVLGLALLNEGSTELVSTVTLGEKVPGGADYTGTATIYHANGTTSTIDVEDGEFVISIPAKGIRSVVLTIPGVQEPGYANPNYEYSNHLRSTVSEHVGGKGHVIQLAPDHYYAYLYLNDMDSTTSEVELSYQVGNQAYVKQKVGYPYEFLIKVDDPTQAFIYQLQSTNTNGGTENRGGGLLKPNDFVDAGITIIEEETIENFNPIEVAVSTAGAGAGNLRFVVSSDSFPFPLAESLLTGLRVAGTLTHKTNGTVLQLDSRLTGNEVRTNGSTVLLVKPTHEVPLFTYSDYTVKLTIYPEPKWGLFESFQLPVSIAGANSEGLRFVVPLASFNRSVSTNLLKDLRITGTLAHKSNGTRLELDSVIKGNEMRANGTTVIVIKPTDEVPLFTYSDYNITLTIHPRAQPTEPDVTPPTAEVAYTTTEATYDPVTATITPSEDITMINNKGTDSYTFLYNGSFTFQFVDLAGNLGEATATVDYIKATSTGAPEKAVLSHNNGHDTGLLDGTYEIIMNQWYGNNAREYRLYENDVLIETQILPDKAPQAQSTTVGIKDRDNGSYRYYAELTNAFGTTRTDEIVVTVKDAAPGKPVISHNNWDHDGDYSIQMDLWWGTNGTTYRLYENRIWIATVELSPNSPSAQSAVVQIENREIGSYAYQAELVNASGSTWSNLITVEVLRK